MDNLYTPRQIENILNRLGIEVIQETYNDFLVFCPFHGNRHTPSFTVSRTHGAYHCQNAACAESGSLINLVRRIHKGTEFEVLRIIDKAKEGAPADVAQQVGDILARSEDLPLFSQETLDNTYKELWTPSGAKALDYLHDRHFEDSTLHHFKIGYSSFRNMVVVPMHDYQGRPVGLIGRTPSKTDKTFKNSIGLPTSRTLWNLHRARAHETVIVVEASFDAMRVHQAGYPNVVACLGGSFNDTHAALLDRYFDTVIIMTDFDDSEKHKYTHCKICVVTGGLEKCVGHNPGRRLGRTIADKMVGKRILWAAWDYKIVYPHDAKDAGDLTDLEIASMVREAVTDFEYTSWGLAS